MLMRAYIATWSKNGHYEVVLIRVGRHVSYLVHDEKALNILL